MPMAWVGAALCLALWPLVVVLSPVTLTVTPGDASRLVLEAGWGTSLLAVLLAQQSLAQNAWLLDQGTPGRALLARLSALITAAWMGQWVGLLGAMVFGGPLGLPWPAIGAATFASTVHLAILAALALQAPIPLVWRSLGLVLLAWVVPALTAGRGGLLEGLGTLLETQHTLEAFLDPSLRGWIGEILPIGALAFALLLAQPSRASRYRPDS